MKFVQANHEGYGFEFNLREKQLFCKVLSLYPLIPSDHHQLSRAAKPADGENQKLLEESLAAHREEARKMVRSLINNPRSFLARGHSFRWAASRAEMESILQVLNDVRVGSWLALGSPNLQTAKNAAATRENEKHYWAMDIAGGFEMIFIAALSGDLPVQTE
jgi:hypothetical protein